MKELPENIENNESEDSGQQGEPETNLMAPFTETESILHETIVTVNNGEIIVRHEMTFGDIIISTLLMLILIFMILSKFIRGS